MCCGKGSSGHGGVCANPQYVHTLLFFISALSFLLLRLGIGGNRVLPMPASTTETETRRFCCRALAIGFGGSSESMHVSTAGNASLFDSHSSSSSSASFSCKVRKLEPVSRREGKSPFLCVWGEGNKMRNK